MVRDGFFGDLLHIGVIVSTSSTSKWPVTSVLGLRIKGGNKNQLWFSPEKEAIRWQ